MHRIQLSYQIVGVGGIEDMSRVYSTECKNFLGYYYPKKQVNNLQVDLQLRPDTHTATPAQASSAPPSIADKSGSADVNG